MNNEKAQIIEDNLNQVWNERNPETRLKAIDRIYTSDAILYHVGNQVSGHGAINNSVTATLKNVPDDFLFTLLRPIVINNSIGRLIWGAGPKGQPPVGTGMDIVHFENDKIKALYVFLD